MENTEWIDVSVTLNSGMQRWPGDPPVCIRRIRNMDKGDSGNLSFISMGSHAGTHMDAPLHCISQGKSLDEMPLDAVIGPARVIQIQDQECVRLREVRKLGIARGERILFKTRNSDFWLTRAFMKNFVYILPETADYLVSRRVQAVGIDYLSVGGYHKEGGKTHLSLLKAEIWIIEGLNLSGVKPGRYDLICLPLKILNSDGAPARAILRPRK